MTSRERVLAAIAHQQPDRVPVDIGSTPSSGISATAYGNLKKHMGINDGHTRIYDVVQQLAQPEDEVLDQLGIDVVDIGRAFNTSDKDWYDIKQTNGATAQYPAWFHPKKKDDGSWTAAATDGTEIAMMPASGFFFDQTHFPYLDAYPDHYKDLPQAMQKVLWAAFAHSPWDHASDPGFWDTLRKNTIELRENTDRALMIVCGCNLFEWGTFLRRMDNFLMDIMIEPDNVKALLEALMEQHMQTLEKVCDAVGDVCDILRFGDDLGMDNGPFMDPATYREVFKPHHTKLCEYVHKNSQMKTFLHSCGSIHSLMPDLIEAGYDVINPVQLNCRDMEADKLKKDFGKDITFWGGGCDTRSILNKATTAEVKTHVLGQLEILAPGGGFVFNTVHNILSDVPPQNIEAMFAAIREFNGE